MKIFYLSLIVFCLFSFYSCKTSQVKELAKSPFDAALFQDSLHLRVAGLGESKVLSTARTIAMHDAQVKLTNLTSSEANNQAAHFTRQYNMSEASEVAVKFEETSSSGSRKNFKNLRVADEKYEKDKNSKTFTYWILLEISLAAP